MASKNYRNYNSDTGADCMITTEAMTAYKFVKVNASDPQKCDLCDTAGELAYGIVDQVWASGENANVYRTGVVPVTAGGVVAANARVAVDASGRAITATAAHAYSVGIARSAATASGDVISVMLDIVPFAGSALNSTSAKVAQAAVGFATGTVETAIGFSLPAKAVVLGVFVDVLVAEATGATKTIDVGTAADPNGFLAGISVASTGIKKGTLLNTGQTLGALLCVDESGAGVLVPEADITSGGAAVTFTPGSADFAELSIVIYIDYLTLA